MQRQLKRLRKSKLKVSFIDLKHLWYKKLKESGFKDVEDHKENLKQYDRRTINFENRHAIHEFFRKLDHYLTDHPEVSESERLVLIMYSEGCYLINIARHLKIDLKFVKKVIEKYKKIVLEQELEEYPSG